MTANTYCQIFTCASNMVGGQVSFIPRSLDGSWVTDDAATLCRRYNSVRHTYEKRKEVCEILSLTPKELSEPLSNVKVAICGSVRKNNKSELDNELVSQCLQVTRNYLLANVEKFTGVAFLPTHHKSLDTNYPLFKWVGYIQAQLAKWLYNENNPYPHRGVWVCLEKPKELSREKRELIQLQNSIQKPSLNNNQLELLL